MINYHLFHSPLNAIPSSNNQVLKLHKTEGKKYLEFTNSYKKLTQENLPEQIAQAKQAWKTAEATDLKGDEP